MLLITHWLKKTLCSPKNSAKLNYTVTLVITKESSESMCNDPTQADVLKEGKRRRNKSN